VTVCQAGGEKEVELLASQLRIRAKQENKEVEILEDTVERQCEKEFFEKVKEKIIKAEAVLSLGCGVGVQALNSWFPEKQSYPAMNTKFLGLTEVPGQWVERCRACGECLLGKTAGICPITRCAKSLLNGPCGGSKKGKCEISDEIDCAWQLIYDRANALGQLQSLTEIIPTRDWSTSSQYGGLGKIVKEECLE
jgi:hypothetical protein